MSSDHCAILQSALNLAQDYGTACFLYDNLEGSGGPLTTSQFSRNFSAIFRNFSAIFPQFFAIRFDPPRPQFFPPPVSSCLNHFLGFFFLRSVLSKFPESIRPINPLLTPQVLGSRTVLQRWPGCIAHSPTHVFQVNAGRTQANHNARNIGSNVNPSEIKFSGNAPQDI